MSRKHVLVVEDEPHIRDLVCLHLGLEGYDCLPIGDGREALKVLSDRPFDLVVLDVMLPAGRQSRCADPGFDRAQGRVGQGLGVG
jgi:DNA-binding response OmpR family regulator